MVGDLDMVQRLVVRGKGNKERVVPIPPGRSTPFGTTSLIRQTLVDARDEPSLLSPIYIVTTPLFVRARRGGRLAPRGRVEITGQAVYHVLRTRAAEAGVKVFSPHDLRRSYVGDLLDGGHSSRSSSPDTRARRRTGRI